MTSRRAGTLGAAVLAALLLPALAHAAVTAAFGAASYKPGDTAFLHVTGLTGRGNLQLFASGPGNQGPLDLAPVDDPRVVRGATIPVHVWSWQSGVYFARLSSAAGTAFAPFVLRPSVIGTTRVAVVEPTYTWQAYNDEGGQSWYFHPASSTVSLTRPYLGGGAPPQYRALELGFLRWLSRTHEQVDVLSDEDLDRMQNGRRLAQLYDLIVFGGHEEYVTQHMYDLTTAYRDAGGNLMFLSANNFFYRVIRSGATISRSGRWRDLGRPEAALVGVQYAGWDERTLPNLPYTVTGADAAPWFFKGSGLHNGSGFGKYGVEIDDVTADSPPGIQVLAQIPDDFGPGISADMTYYERGAAKVFAAGVMNFGASANWPVVSTLMANLWARFTAP